MATIKDIAKLAGVSHGTVSNVINQKGNVSTGKIRLVEDAARHLGYNTNAQAQRLRKEYNRHLAFILPGIEQRIYHVFYTNLKTALEEQGYDTSLYLTGNSLENERLCIRTALSNRPEYIVTFTCAEDPGEYAGLNAKIIFINNPSIIPQKNQSSLYFDFESAGAAFAEKAAAQKIKTLAFFSDSPALPANRAFFQSLCKNLDPQSIEVIPFYYDSRQIYNGAIAILEKDPPVDLVVTTDPFRAEKLTQMQDLLGFRLPKIMSFGISETLRSCSYPYYEFDYREMAQMACSVIKENKNLGKRIPLKAKGFAAVWKTTSALRTNKEITLLIGTYPSAKILSTLVPHFQRSTGITLKVVVLPYEELFFLLSSGKVAHYDLIRMDMAWCSRFEQNLFISLASLADKITPLIESFLPSIQSVYCPDIKSLYSIPFDPSIQMLFYRRDLFENATLKRLYYEQTRKQLEVPKTFAEYNRIAAFFTSKLNSAAPTQFGTTMTYGSATSAACEILPRIKSLGGEFFDRSGKIAVATPLFKKALDEYLAMKDYSGSEVNYWWEDALYSFTSGLSAMTILFINRASSIIRANSLLTYNKVGVAPVPGNYPLLGGGSIGISNQSRHPDRCIEFLKWVYNDEVAHMITLLGGLSPCQTVFRNEEILEVYPWLRNIREYFKSGSRRITGKRYPHFDNYHFERILGDAVRSAAMGLISPEEALENAQRQCDTELKKTYRE